jgi:hypothetical protein
VHYWRHGRHQTSVCTWWGGCSQCRRLNKDLGGGDTLDRWPYKRTRSCLSACVSGCCRSSCAACGEALRTSTGFYSRRLPGAGSSGPGRGTERSSDFGEGSSWTGQHAALGS